MKPAWIIGFSGHRHLARPDLARAGIHVGLSRSKEKIARAGGRLHLFVSAAYGADLLAIEVAESLQIPVHIILPKPLFFLEDGSISTSEGFGADYRDAAGNLLIDAWERAHHWIRKAQRGEDGWTYRLVNGTQVDPECYYDAGVQVMEASDLFLAVWDRQPARGLGGTAEMVEQAEKLQLPTILCDPLTGHFEELRTENFDPEADEGHKLMLTLSLDEKTCRQNFDDLDRRANLHSSRFRNAVVKGIWLHALATITAAIAALLHGTSLAAAQWLAALALFEWILVAVAWIKMKSLSRGETHLQWIRNRFAVELMRAMFGSITLIDPLSPAVSRHKKEWQRFAVSAGLSLAAEQTGHKPWQEERARYVHARLECPETGQIPHFLQKQAEAAPVFDRLSRLQKAASSFAVVFVFGAFLYKGSHAVYGSMTGQPIPIPQGIANVAVVVSFKFLPIALPLIAGVAAALRSAKDSGRRKYRYKELAQRLQVAREQLIHLKTESSCRRCVTVIEEVLLDELIEWHLSEKQNGSH